MIDDTSVSNARQVRERERASSYLCDSHVDAWDNKRRVELEHVQQNVEDLSAHAAEAKERVAAVVHAQQPVALSRDGLVVALGRVHVDPVAREVQDHKKQERVYVLRIQVRQNEQQTGRGAATLSANAREHHPGSQSHTRKTSYRSVTMSSTAPNDEPTAAQSIISTRRT